MIISKHLNKILFDNDMDKCLMDICDKMESYVIQDLIDYCNKVLFEVFKGKCCLLIQMFSCIRENKNYCDSMSKYYA